MEEHDHLKQVDRLIADGKRSIARQRVVVERLQANGLDVMMARRVLEAFESSHAAHRADREMILQRIARGSPAPPRS